MRESRAAEWLTYRLVVDAHFHGHDGALLLHQVLDFPLQFALTPNPSPEGLPCIHILAMSQNPALKDTLKLL